MITKEKLQKYAHNLMFEMSDEEYKTLQEEFDVIIKQMDLIDKIDGISEVEPMHYPFVTHQATLREDISKESLSIDEILQNTTCISNDQIKVPKVVE